MPIILSKRTGGGGSSGGVTSLDGLSGAVTLSEGDGITLTTVGQDIEIAASGGGDSELAFAQITSNVDITSTTAATPTEVISAGAVVFDGSTRVCIEFFCMQVRSSHQFVVLTLWDDATQLSRFGVVQIALDVNMPVLLRRILTPSAGSHTYKVTAYKSGGTGTITAGTGSGGDGANVPAYIRIATLDAV
jgi:hypothetical protein